MANEREVTPGRMERAAPGYRDEGRAAAMERRGITDPRVADQLERTAAQRIARRDATSTGRSSTTSTSLARARARIDAARLASTN